MWLCVGNSLIRYLASHIRNDHMCGRYLVAAGHLNMNGFYGDEKLFSACWIEYWKTRGMEDQKPEKVFESFKSLTITHISHLCHQFLTDSNWNFVLLFFLSLLFVRIRNSQTTLQVYTEKLHSYTKQTGIKHFTKLFSR